MPSIFLEQTGQHVRVPNHPDKSRRLESQRGHGMDAHTCSPANFDNLLPQFEPRYRIVGFCHSADIHNWICFNLRELDFDEIFR